MNADMSVGQVYRKQEAIKLISLWSFKRLFFKNGQHYFDAILHIVLNTLFHLLFGFRNTSVYLKCCTDNCVNISQFWTLLVM